MNSLVCVKLDVGNGNEPRLLVPYALSQPTGGSNGSTNGMNLCSPSINSRCQRCALLILERPPMCNALPIQICRRGSHRLPNRLTCWRSVTSDTDSRTSSERSFPARSRHLLGNFRNFLNNHELATFHVDESCVIGVNFR
jgi:hypothetical protein